MIKDKFVIVDGSSMLSTCYYAVLPREIMFAKTEEEKQKHYGKILHAKDGTYTNALFGMLKMVASLIKKQKPGYMAFVFDKTRDTFRREMYPEYKGNRKATPAPLKQQFILVETILEEAGFQVLCSDRYEADDYAGTLVSRFCEKAPMVVMTKDHDYLQLVNDKHNVRAWLVQAKQEKADELYEKYYASYGMSKKELNLPEKTFEFTEAHVLAEEGVWPEQIADLKGIMGDSSDNIPGVKGVSSAAALLLNEYGSVESLYEAIHEAQEDKALLKELQDFWKVKLGIARSPLKALTKKGAEGELCGEAAAFLSKQLATLKKDIVLEQELDDFTMGAYREEILRDWCKKLDIKAASVFV